MNSAARPEDEPLDAYSARLYRPPMPTGAMVDLVLMQETEPADAFAACPAAEALRKKGRLGRVFQVCSGAEWNIGEAMTNAIGEMQSPLFIISDANAKWNKDILERLLKAIDSADMAIGSRQAAGRVQKWRQWLTATRRSWFWGAGVKDGRLALMVARLQRCATYWLPSSSRRRSRAARMVGAAAEVVMM